MESESLAPANYSRYSCTSCKRLKKKCDRREPECSLCQRYHTPGSSCDTATNSYFRHGRSCSYRPTHSSARRRLASEESISPARTATHRSQQRSDSFPAVYFVDSALFRHSLGHLPETNVQSVADIQRPAEYLSDIKQYVDVYFKDIHPWAPFLSKRKVLGQVLSPLGGNRVDHSILLTAIKLMITAPGDDARSAAYYQIKTALLDAELKGIFTLRLLQSQVLVAMYEKGHAIYPSAYLTVGCCAKYGIALGINQTIDPNCGARSTSADSEEERRTWWAILLLDR